MPKYLITWDAGFGENNNVIEAETEEEAMEQAYECWKEEAESYAAYSARILTEELAEEYGFDFED